MNLRGIIFRRLLGADEAWANGDIASFLEVFSPEVISVTSAGISVGRDSLEARLRQSYGSQLDGELRTSVETFDLVSEGVAALSGAFRLRRSDGREIAGTFSQVWVQQPGGPRVVLDHATLSD